MRIRVLDLAERDLAEGRRFYDDQQPGLGDYFVRCLLSDLHSLHLYAGIHRVFHGRYHRLLSKRFPFAVFYTVAEDTVIIHAVLDCRRSPSWIRKRLE
jgi:hypothetical protein